MPEGPDAHADYLRAALEKLRTKLIDQTRRNRLINYKEAARDVAIIDEVPNQVYEHLIVNNRTFRFLYLEEEEEPDEDGIEEINHLEDEVDRTLPHIEHDGLGVPERYTDDALQTPFSKRDLERRLRRLYQEHRTMIEETGANNLYLAIGFLEWHEQRQEETLAFRSPLMLLPVRLERERAAGDAVYRLRFDDEALDTNYSLAERLWHDFEITLPPLEDEELPEKYWRRVSDAIARRQSEGWGVAREMALGLFRFNKQIMWHDLDPGRWPRGTSLLSNKLIQRILLGPSADQTAPGQLIDEYDQDGLQQTNDSKLRLIRDADSSQYAALVDALGREDGLVIEGPPGTGKSQTITNLIAVALDQGLSVLFVAEKMAALEVVYRRLDENGLGPFCLQLHGLRTNKKELLESIRERLDYRTAAPRELRQREQSLNRARTELIQTSEALLAKVGPEELPLYEVPWRLERNRQSLPEHFEPVEIADVESVTYEQLEHGKNLLNDLAQEWASIPQAARKAWDGFEPTRYEQRYEHDVLSSLAAAKEAALETGEWLEARHASIVAPSLFEAVRILKLGGLDTPDALPPIPVGIDSSIIYRALDEDRVNDFANLLQVLTEYLGLVRQVNAVFDYASPGADKYAEALRIHAGKLYSSACSQETRVKELDNELATFRRLSQDLKTVDSAIMPVTVLRSVSSRTLSDLYTIETVAAELTSGPKELSLHGTPSHVKASARSYLGQATSVAKDLEERSSKLEEHFHVSRLRDTQKFEHALGTVNANRAAWLPLLSKEYREARKYIRSVLVHPKVFSRKPETLDVLQEAADFCTARDRFRDNKDYRAILGSTFEGIDTDWDALHALVDFAQELREAVGVEKAREIVGDWDSHIEKMATVREFISRIRTSVEQFSKLHPFPELLWERPIPDIAETLDLWSRDIESANNAIAQPWCSGEATLSEALQAVDRYRVAKEKESSIERDPSFAAVLEPMWQKSQTNEALCSAALKWVRERLGTDGINSELIKWLFDENHNLRRELFDELVSQASSFRSKFRDQRALLETLGKVRIYDWVGAAEGTLRGFAEKLEGCRDTMASLPLLQRWRVLKDQTSDVGLESFAEEVARGELVSSNAGIAFEYSVYSTLLRSRIRADPILDGFGNERYEGLRHRYAKLDEEILRLNADAVASEAQSRDVPQGIHYGRVRNYSDKGLLIHEAGKKRRHIPIRQLVRRSKNALQALKPCFLMSPLSVAQFLPPGEVEFDLVVMDEASQLRPEDALGATARAKKTVIVGDPKQLPPTSFFDAAVAEDEEAEETIVDDAESILDVCLKQFPFRRLRWHYRSQHEALIQFSNDSFYDGDLVVFPSPKRKSRLLGVHSTHIDTPSYRNGRNRNEAAIVVENIVQHFYHHSDASLGVAAFNKRQAEEIQLLLDRARSEDPVLDKRISESHLEEPLFVKNLENVQGDERDVIFISTTYGPESAGAPVHQRFGPINSELGWRRLNVIATRAKQRVEVFTSMRPGDIRIGEGTRKGARALRDYLEYAETGKVSDRGRPTGRDYDSEFEEAVANLLREMGFESDPQVGVAGFFIDLGVIHPDRPGEYLMGIECDGAAYHSAKSARDRDRLRQEILERKGWYIHRIWSTSWFHTRSNEIERLRQVLGERLDRDRKVQEAAAQESEEPEILTAIPQATQQELAEEEEAVRESLEEALERYWSVNIKPYFPDRSHSLLSRQAIRALVSNTPTTEEEWFRAVPVNIRESMNPHERPYLDDVLEVIAEYE